MLSKLPHFASQISRPRILLAILVITLCAGLASYTVADGFQTQWMMAPVNHLDCPSHLRCAEWCVLVDTGWEPLYSCCISPVADPTDQAACQGLRQIE